MTCIQSRHYVISPVDRGYSGHWRQSLFLYILWLHIDGLVQGRRNSSALAMELRLSITNPSICTWCMNQTIQPSAVITRPNMVRYCINNCRNWGRISNRCWTHKDTPYIAVTGALWGVFCELCVTNDHVITAPHHTFKKSDLHHVM